MNTAKQPFILDHLQGITTGTKSPLVNDAAIFQGLCGIHALALAVRGEEIDFAQKTPHAPGLVGSWHHVPPWLPSMFNWFSVSVVNHLRLVALVELLCREGWTTGDLADPAKRAQVKPHCTAFVKGVVPKIYTWRNKVGAHFAATDPQGDVAHILEQSIWTPVTYSYPHYIIGSVVPGSAPDPLAGLPIWSVTRTFEDLKSRFWPNFHLPPGPPPRRKQSTTASEQP